jgi:integrase
MRINGVYYFRQRVPRDLVAQVGRKFVKESLKTTNADIAKRRNAEAIAKYAATWTHLRRNPLGMHPREATAIAGEVYREFMERHRDGDRHFWAKHHWTWRHYVLSVACGLVDRGKNWTNETPDTEFLRGQVGDALRTVLKRAGMVVDDGLFNHLLRESGKAVVQGIEQILRECDGDYRPDPDASRFPPFVSPKDRARRSTLAEEVWAAGKAGWSPATRKKYRHALDDFLAQLPSYGLRQTRGDWDLARITKDHVRAWRDGLLVRLKGEATARTVKLEYLGSLKAVFASAVRGERLAENPATGVGVEAAWGQKAEERRGFFDEEVQAILRATLAPTGPRMSAHRAAAHRWVPWLCAYTGARVNEITQLRCQDVVQRDGCWCVHITPDAGGQKMGSKRLVPLHEHLVEQGFVEFARRFRPAQPLFHAYEIPDLEDVPENEELRAEHRRRAAAAAETIGGRLATWVRSLGGVDAEDVDPNHGWRHRFKTEGRACGMDLVILDAIQGHAPPNVSSKYGDFAPRITGPQIAKLPRIVVDVL